jgi:hypothetical protein
VFAGFVLSNRIKFCIQVSSIQGSSKMVAPDGSHSGVAAADVPASSINSSDSAANNNSSKSDHSEPAKSSQSESFKSAQSESSNFSEHQKMLAGHLYSATDPELVAARYRARILLNKINNFPICDPHEGDAVCSLKSEDFANATRSATVFRDAMIKANDAMVAGRGALVKKLIPNSGKNLYIEPPFQCDYGSEKDYMKYLIRGEYQCLKLNSSNL